MRCATSLASRPAACASARCTSSLLTPTRNAPPISLTSRKHLGGVELPPPAAQRLGLHRRRLAAQRQQALLDPFGQAGVAACGVVVRQRQHVRDGLGQIAHRLVAGLEQPVVDGGGVARGAAQHRGGHGLARLAAGQEVRGPRGVGRRRGREVALHRVDLVRGRRAGVELLEQRGEGLHVAVGSVAASAVSASSASSPYAVAKLCACRPCCCSQRTITAS